jgi:DHA2 family methylenomycin A resistance protein-like MFS transporter
VLARLALIAPFAGRITGAVGPRLPMAIGLLSAAVGVGLLSTVGPGSSYASELPALLLWGIGMGFLTPAVVHAAVDAVPADRAGLASASTTPPARRVGRSGSPPAARSPGRRAGTASSTAFTRWRWRRR